MSLIVSQSLYYLHLIYTKEQRLHTLPSNVLLILESYFFRDGLFQQPPPFFAPNHLGFSSIGPPAKRNQHSFHPASIRGPPADGIKGKRGGRRLIRRGEGGI